MNERISKNDFGVGTQALRLLRDATSDLCDVTAFAAQDAFRFASIVAPAGHGVLVESRLSGLSYDRTSRHIARSGIDHFQVTLFLSDAAFSSGRRNVAMRAGDVLLIDMAQANRTTMIADSHTGLSHALCLLLPRAFLAPLLASPDSATASLLTRDTQQGQLLAEQLRILYNRGEQLAPGEAAATVDAVAGLVADGVGRRPDAENIVGRAKSQALMASIKHHIDAYLETEMITVERLCGHFRLSRATLYRLFEPDGGLSRYIQDQRLNRAFRRLLSPAFRKARMIDFAVDFHFSSDATFVRAFRRQFGLTPGEVRHLANRMASPDAALWPWQLLKNN